MKYLKIFFLYFQHVTNFRSRIFIWFLTSFLNPLFVLIFWIAVIKDNGNVLGSWNLSSITTYYLLLIIAGSFIIAHIEEDVAIKDIREGQLVTHIIKPMSYFWMKFLSELGWRIMQGFFGVLIFIIFYIFFQRFVSLPNTFSEIIFSALIIILAFLISFTFKMIIGITAFWFIDFWGLQQITEVIIVILAGFIMPIELFPSWLENLSKITPFPYMIYYPIISLQSKLTNPQLINIVLIQTVWLVILGGTYKWLWGRGIKKFTGVGQ